MATPRIIASEKTKEYAARFSGSDGFCDFLDLAYARLKYHPPTRVHYAMARRMQNGPRKQVILAPRSAAKSTVAANYGDYRLLGDPQDKIVVISKSARHAKKFTNSMLKTIRALDFMKHLAPTRNQKRSAMDFDLSEAIPSIHSSVAAFGIETQIAGAKGSLVIPDDIETPENARTEPSRDVLDEQVRDFINLQIPGREMQILYLGTPHSPDQSLYLKLRDRGYDIWAWPICYPSPELFEEMKSYLAPELLEDIRKDPSLMVDGPVPKVGKITDPQWFRDVDVRDRYAEGWEQFLTQSMMCLTVTNPEAFHFRCRDLPVVSLMPEIGPEIVIPSNESKFALTDLSCPGPAGDMWYSPSEIRGSNPYDETIMSIDPSGEGEKETAFAVVSGSPEYIFWLASGGYRAGFSPETLEAICRKVLRWRVTMIFDEKNYGGGTWRELLRLTLNRICNDPNECANFGIRAPWICGFTEDGYSRQTNKEQWIFRALSTPIQNRKLIINRQLIEEDNLFGYPGMSGSRSKQYRALYQLTHFEGLTKAIPILDRIDALAYGVYYFREKLARSAEQAQRDREAAREDAEWQEFMQSEGGFLEQYQKKRDNPNYFATNRLTKYLESN